MALLSFAYGEKKLITSSSKKVSPVAPRSWAYAAKYILPPMEPASSWTASRGAIEDGGEFCQCDGCRLVERSGRAAAQDYLLGRVLRLFFFLQVPQFNFLARRSGRYQGGSLPAPLSYLFLGLKRRRV